VLLVIFRRGLEAFGDEMYIPLSGRMPDADFFWNAWRTQQRRRHVPDLHAARCRRACSPPRFETLEEAVAELNTATMGSPEPVLAKPDDHQ